MALETKLDIQQKSTFQFSVSMTQSGTPIDLSAWDYYFALKETEDAASAALSLTKGSGIEFDASSAPDNNRIIVTITATQSEALDPTICYFFDLRVVSDTDPETNAFLLVFGRANVQRSIS